MTFHQFLRFSLKYFFDRHFSIDAIITPSSLMRSILSISHNLFDSYLPLTHNILVLISLFDRSQDSMLPLINILDLISTSHYYSIQYNRLFHHSLHPILSSTRISIWSKRIIHIGRILNPQISSKFTSSRPDISSKTHEILIS